LIPILFILSNKTSFFAIKKNNMIVLEIAKKILEVTKKIILENLKLKDIII
jgi:hypothetical protein